MRLKTLGVFLVLALSVFTMAYWLSDGLRRDTIAVEQTESSVLLITDAAAARPLPLPVAQRFELSLHADLLSVRIAKDRRGRVMGPRKVRASAMRSAAAANAASAHSDTEFGHAQQQLSA